MADNLPANNYPKFDPKAAASGNNLPATNQSKPPSAHVQQPNQPQQPQQPRQPQNPPNTAQAANVNVNQPVGSLVNIDYRNLQNATALYTNTQNHIDQHLAYHNEIHQKWKGIRRTGIKAGILGGAWGVLNATGLWGVGQTFAGALLAGSPVGVGLLALTAGIWAYGKYIAKPKNEEHNRKMGVKDKSGAYTQGSYGAQLDQQKEELVKQKDRGEPVQVDWTQSKGLLDKIYDEMSEKRKNNMFWKKAGNIGVATGVFGTTQMLLGAHILPGGGPALAAMGIVADAVCRLTMNRSILTFDKARPKEDRTGLYIGVPYMKGSAGSLSGGIRLFGKDNIRHPKEKSRLDIFQENIDFCDDQAKRGVLFETTFEPKKNRNKPAGVSHTVYPT